MKALGHVVSDKNYKLHFENLFLNPINLLIQPTGMFWTTLIEEHLGIIPAKFVQNPMSGFGGEVVWMKKFTHAHTDGQQTKDCHNSSLWVLCAQVS